MADEVDQPSLVTARSGPTAVDEFGPDRRRFGLELSAAVERCLDEPTLTRAHRRIQHKALYVGAWYISSYVLLVVAGTWWLGIVACISFAVSMAGVGFNIQHDANHNAMFRTHGSKRLDRGQPGRRLVDVRARRQRHTVDQRACAGPPLGDQRRWEGLRHRAEGLGSLGPATDQVPLAPLSASVPVGSLLFHRGIDHRGRRHRDGYRVVHRRSSRQAPLRGRVHGAADHEGGVRVRDGRRPVVLPPVVDRDARGGASPWRSPVCSSGSSSSWPMLWSRPRSAAAMNVPVVAGTNGKSARPLTSATVVAQSARLVTWYTGGLNYQTEHHLFPRVPHTAYPEIVPVVQQVCEGSRSRTGCSPRCAAPSARTIATCAVSDGPEPVGAQTAG